MSGLIVPRFRLSPAAFTAIIDKREKKPLSLAPLRTEFATLVTGDYTIKWLNPFVAVERKSLLDLIHGLRCRRHQVESQVERLLKIPKRLLIIEAAPLDVDRARWPHSDEITPDFVAETIARWQAHGLPVEYAGTHERASRRVVQFLRAAADEHFENYGPFFTSLGVHPVRANNHSPSSTTPSATAGLPSGAKFDPTLPSPTAKRAA